MDNPTRYGVLLVNLGTPDEATPQAVKRFLSQFLHDKRVVDMSRWLWCPLLHGIILPVRSPKVAKLYQGVWMEEGSPLMVYSRKQAQCLRDKLNVPVELGMTYGNPSLLDGVSRLQQQGVEEILVLPLYPQYSATTTAAVVDGLAKTFRQMTVIPPYRVLGDYHDNPLYIKALAQSVRQFWQDNGRGDYLLCSYHGIPQRYADNGDVYPLQCVQTTQLLAKELGLTEDEIGMSYQSRFGREEWLKPYTDATLKELGRQGRSLDIITPAFSVDCLETLEEIAVECKQEFVQAGGGEYRYIPCLNDNEAHIEMMASLIQGEG